MDNSLLNEIKRKFGENSYEFQPTKDTTPTIWIDKSLLKEMLLFLKNDISHPFKMLYDIHGIDERSRSNKAKPTKDFTVFYHLFSFDRNGDIRIKIPLEEENLNVPSITNIYSNANWYEREIWDMFGIRFEGHPHLRRILMPPYWEGHPLRKEHPARATEMGQFKMTEDYRDAQMEALQFKPEEWGMHKDPDDHSEFMFMNLGPQHPGTHGVLRLIVQLDGEEIVDVVPDIGYHHRAKEKMGERQSWHTFIPYTDRVDYLGGVVNNFAYLLSVEALAGIVVPERAQMIRIMMSEFFRISNHLVWYGTFAQDVGQLSPVFYMFNDREKIMEFVEAVCGDRLHPNWFRIGGVAQDLPNGWEVMVKEFLNYFPPKIKEYEGLVLKNRVFKARTIGIGAFTKEEAIEWGVTGPNLRATGFEWDFRKKRPYSGFENIPFEVPVGKNGDSFDRAIVRNEEMKQSLRIIEYCMKNMPAGPYKSDHPSTTPPLKDKTMIDIETLINHFLNVSWGPVIPPGEALIHFEATKGNNGYYLISDGSTAPYRVRIRTPSFPHMQMVPYISRGHTVADLLAILGSYDFVLADIDR
jgi:NADH-quinone oxidoreductase subunit C/D